MLNGTSPKIGQNHFNKNIVAKGQNIENKRESLHQNDLFWRSEYQKSFPQKQKDFISLVNYYFIEKFIDEKL
jgi:hypothetical protein